MSINQAINIQTTTLNAIAPSGSLSIGDTQTTGALNMGTNAGRTGGINIATSSAICPINIMNGATTGGSVNIANGTGASQTTTVNIGTGSTTGAVTIGGGSNVINLAVPPTLTYASLPTFTTTQIGYTFSSVIATDTNVAASNTYANPFSAFTLPVGVYSMVYQIRYKTASGSTTLSTVSSACSFATTQNSITNYGLKWDRSMSILVDTTGNWSHTGSTILRNNTASNVLTFSNLAIYTGASGTLRYVGSDCYFIVTRIA